MTHIPVLLKEVIEILNPKPGEFFIDGTVGSGGHALEILKKIGPKGKLLGIDLDQKQLEKTYQSILRTSDVLIWTSDVLKLKIKDTEIILVQGNYADLPEILKENKLPKADGLLLDLGMSSEQLEHSGRGFSFMKNEPLIMQYQFQEVRPPRGSTSRILTSIYEEVGPRKIETAAEVVNSFSEKELAEIIYKYGEERFSRKIAQKIVEERRKKRILTTFELVEVIKKSVPKNYERGRIHPATRTFMALRIYINQELTNLEKLLNSLEQALKIGGRIAIISFHSLEDRIVKNYFREKFKERKMEILTKKPIGPTFQEIQANPRSRSAKLRACSIILSPKDAEIIDSKP